MFPEETHVKILKRLDDMEADAFRHYRKLASLRLELQQQWKAFPSGERWSAEKQSKAEGDVR